MFAISSMDTLLLMGMNAEYEQCRGWLSSLSGQLGEAGAIGTHDAFARVLGAVLAAHAITSDPALLRFARDLAGRCVFSAFHCGD